MNQDNIFSIGSRFIASSIIFDLINFPLWWYSTGLKERWHVLLKNVKEANRRLALLLWLKNIFVPMYGYYDIWSRLISFMMRLILLPFKFLIFCLWSLLYLFIFLFYFFLPPFIIFMLIKSF